MLRWTDYMWVGKVAQEKISTADWQAKEVTFELK